MRIAITGGSGFIGTNYIDFLCELPHISILNIDKIGPRSADHVRFWVECDLLDFSRLERVLDEFDPEYVVHLAADTGVDLRDISDFKCNYLGVDNLVRACSKLVNLKHIVFASSLLVCKVGHIPTSDNEYIPTTAYGQSKVMGEQVVRDLKNHNFTWTIVRPISIWGPWNYQPYLSFFRYVIAGYYFHIGSGHYRRSLGYVGNTVRQIHSLLLANHTLVNSKTFYLADPKPVDLFNMSECIRSIAGSRSIRSLPLVLAFVLAKIGDLLQLIGWRNVPLTSFRLKNIRTEYVFDLSPIHSLSEFQYIEMEEGIRRTLDHIRNVG